MNERKVDARDTETREASLETPPHAIFRIVQARTKRQRIGIAEIALPARRHRFEHATDLRGKLGSRAGPGAKGFADPLFAAAVAVERRRVEIRNAGSERRVDRRECRFVAERAI